jgi:hypothetical protein
MMRLSFGSNAENGSNLSALDRDTSPAPADNGTPRFRNFDLVRLVAATSVVFSHAFDIVNGDAHAEPLVMLLGPGNILGIYGVYTFFIISGFLITASFKKSSFSSYAQKRLRGHCQSRRPHSRQMHKSVNRRPKLTHLATRSCR